MRPSPTLLASGLTSLATLTSAAAADTQQIALASYIHPLGDPSAWNRIVSYPNSKISVLVANVLNGPDTAVNPDWQSVITRASASGKRVMGYVRTGYLGLSQQHMTTRLGSSQLADWIAQIESDVTQWYDLYGASVMGGIFFDEAWNDCGPDNQYAEVYKYINQWTKRRYPGAFTVVNPGATMPKCFEEAADTLLTFERGYDAYLNDYQGNGWPATDGRKIWHIVYGVPEEAVASVASLAKERGAGFIHITDDGLDNPYDNLPKDSYMQKEMAAVSGGVPAIAKATWQGSGTTAPATPKGLAVVSSASTSVALSWSAVSGAYGYVIYVGGKEKLSLPASVTRTTVVGLAPGSSFQFVISALGANGKESARSAAVSASTTKSRRTRAERRGLSAN